MAADELPRRFPSQESADNFIKTLKIVKASKGILKALDPICTNELELDHMLVKLLCRHWFHRDYLLKRLGQNNACLMCRSELPKEPVKRYERGGRLENGDGFSIIVYGSSRRIGVGVREENDSHYVTVWIL